MRFPSMLRRLRNTQGGMGSSAGSGSTPYPYTPNQPPVARAGSDQIVSVNTTVNFDGSGSTDPDGGNLTYKWTFDAGPSPATATTPQASYKYTTHGEKIVTLTVTDDGGVSRSDTLTVKVISIDPQTVNDGESPVFSVLGATDATAFSWGWELPSDLGLNPDVGNSPRVVFLPPKPPEPPNTTTIDRAKWYAHPNLACGAANRIASRSSKYTITCDITFPNETFRATSSLTVKVPDKWTIQAGGVKPSVQVNSYQTYFDKSAQVHKIKPGTLNVTRTVTLTINIPSSSYFYHKVVEHENKHVAQLNPGGIGEDLFNVPDDLWDYPYPTQKEISLKDAQGTDLGSLHLSVTVRTANFREEEDERFDARIPAMEREAYSDSGSTRPTIHFSEVWSIFFALMKLLPVLFLASVACSVWADCHYSP